jgi:hypothetical protein
MSTATTAAHAEELGFTLPPGDAVSGLNAPGAAEGVRTRGRVSGYVTLIEGSHQTTPVSPPDESGMALVNITMSEEFSGGLTGTGVASHIGVRRADGSISATGIERITGTLGGRSGSFAITSAAAYDRDNVAHGRWTAVAGSGTGELEGLHAEGTFSVAWGPHGALSIYTLTYWFDAEPDQDRTR